MHLERIEEEGKHCNVAYLSSNHIATFCIAILVPHERGAHEILRLDVDKVLCPANVVNVGQMNTVIHQSTFLLVQATAVFNVPTSSFLESFGELGVLLFHSSPVHLLLLNTCLAPDGWIKGIHS